MGLHTLRIGALAALLALGAACGDDDSDTDSAADTKADAPTKAEYIAEADAICAKYNEESDKLAEGLDENEADPAVIQRFLQDLFDLTQKSIDEIRALTLPEGEAQQEIDAAIDELEGLMADVDEQIATPEKAIEFATSEDDPFAGINEKFTALGFKDCGTEE